MKDTDICRHSESLLVRREAAGLDPDAAARLQQHLDNCAACRRFGRTLGQFAPALAGDERPRPHVQAELHRRLKKRHPLARIAEIRVPAYQALLGAAAALLLLLAAEGPGPQAIQSADLAPTAAPVPSPADSYEVIANVRLLDHQRRGRVHAEDSLLITYPTSAGSI